MEQEMGKVEIAVEVTMGVDEKEDCVVSIEPSSLGFASRENYIGMDRDEEGTPNMSESEGNVKCLQVMSIVPDKQEVSLVDKVHIEENCVFTLCNCMVPGSVDRRGENVKINHNALNRLSLPAIGMYGDKCMMRRMLVQIGAVDEATSEKMANDDFKPGLYVCQMENCMVVFYWHQELRMAAAARKQISCNFIRYLVELCENVFVLVEEGNVLKALTALSSNNDRRSRRNRRLKVSQVQNSTNDVQISKGFNLDIAMSVRFTAPQGFLSIPERGLFFTEGYYRCAFLTPAFKEKTEFLQDLRVSAPAKEILSKIQNLKKDYYVDFTQLEDKEFVAFLSHSGSPEYESHRKLEEGVKRRREQCEKGFNIESKCREAEERVRNAIIDTLPEVCTYFKFLKNKAVLNERPFEYLEQTIASAGSMGSSGGSQRLVFSGSDIIFLKKDGQSVEYSVDVVKDSAYRGPITNAQHLLLKSSTGKTFQAWFLYGSMSHPLPSESKFVLSGEDVTLVTKGGDKEAGVITSVETPNATFKMFIQQFLPPHVRRVLQNFRFLCYNVRGGCENELIRFWQPVKDKLQKDKRYFQGKEILLAFCDGQESLKSLDSSVIRKYLVEGNANDLLKVIESLKDKESLDKYKEDLCGFELDIDALKRGGYFFSEWESICSYACNQVKETSKDSILTMVRKMVLPILNNQFIRQKEKLRKELEQCLTEEKSKFLMETKKKLSGGSGERRMSIGSCTVQNNWRFAVQVELMTCTEEIENPKVIWMVTEVVPNKKDIEKLSLNSMHSITPSCLEPCELLTVDPGIDELKSVGFLKSGKVLLFVHNKKDNRLDLYVYPKLGPHSTSPIHSFRRGFDLMAFEESTRFLALYDRNISKIAIYKFDENFRNIDWTGVQITLDIYAGSCNLKWMKCIPNRAELLIVDDTNRIRVVELHHQPLVRPRHITLTSDVVSGCISQDGSFLFLLEEKKMQGGNKACEEGHNENMGISEVLVQIYLLGESMCFLKNLSLGVHVQDLADLKLNIISLGGQNHLVMHSSMHHEKVSSNVLTITSATLVSKFEEVSKHKADCGSTERESMDQSFLQSCATLNYLYHIYDKFAVYPALSDGKSKKQCFHLLLKEPSDGSADQISKKCKEYVTNLKTQLEKEKGKDFSKYEVEFQTYMFHNWNCNHVEEFPFENQKKEMGDWIRLLVCLVPVQICRAYNNGVQPLLDGLQIPPHLTYVDTTSLANLLRFGLYDTILGQWDGNIKIISSMGKQSSGKSFLLNHLSGSLLDVAGGRCTDGVWMTVRVVSDCLYVLMDFEGLGSFERTEQEDMLLSVLNAAVSNVTIFNKKDFHLDKETESVFQRFQNGVNLVKHDAKLFKGLFYIAIKDVDASDVEELKDEFHKKLQHICEKSEENFLTKMYRGEVEIDAMPPFTKSEYYQESLAEAASSVEESVPSYESGRAFLTDLKILIAQITAKDWTPVDMKRVTMRVDVLRKNMASAVKEGCLAKSEALVNFDKDEAIADSPLEMKDMCIVLPDTNLVLDSLDESTTKEETLRDLRFKFEEIMCRKGKKNDYWHTTFEEFLEALANRRRDRVQSWIQCNTLEFSSNSEVQKLQSEANSALAELNQGLSICGSKCSLCFWRCVLEKGHFSDHSCMGSHVCPEKCTFCSLDSYEGEAEECQSLAGHEGNHNCQRRDHTCREKCHLFDKSSNCATTCSLAVDHQGPHRCNSPQHVCGKKCSLVTCTNTCIIRIEAGDHERHACQERYCPEKCIMNGCRRNCGSEDHFHSLSSKQHLCGLEHSCQEECQEDGICEIITQLKREKRFFHGKRDCFEYEHVSDQNGLKKDCCVIIPPFETSHQGGHFHTLAPDVVHYCKERCGACGYFCQRPINHMGLHDTVHGNMRKVYFASENEEVDIGIRKYTWGESGVAEMCNMHCRVQGRGHVHLIRCPKNDSMSCTSGIYDGARHETRKYGPDVDVPKDELTHETYWSHMRFEDPCTEEDRNQFALCYHYCRSEEHIQANGTLTKSYCTEKLWHPPLKSASVLATGGHITPDGHSFSCNHSRNVLHHVIFVIDKSGSMASQDVKIELAKHIPSHNCRLGCAYEAITRFISTRRRTTTNDILSIVLFDSDATLAVETQEMKEDIVDRLLTYTAGGLTSYSEGLQVAEQVMVRGAKHAAYNTMKPVIIFLSDGGNNDGLDPLDYVNNLKKEEPEIILHTVMFGKDPHTEILERMATVGNGTFRRSLNEVELARSFESLAESLKPRVAALM